MSRVSFHESLEQIEMNLLSMGELAGTSVQRSVEALVQHDDAKAQTVIDDDDTVDELYLKIDSDVLSVLALQSPVAADLRLISAIMHCNLHLERVGD
ncbi:MAG: PhoU domain-containing protein, partial [Actinomycetota bacterium]